MTPENFCYWLQGWFELNDTQGLDKREASIETVDMIKEHLGLVLNKVTSTPIRNCPDSNKSPSPTITGEMDWSILQPPSKRQKEELLYC